MDIASKIPNIMGYIRKGTATINPDEKSHLGLVVPQIVMDNGSIRAKIMTFPLIGKKLLGSIKAMKESYRDLYNQPVDAITTISKQDFKDLKVYIKSLDIDDVGFTTVNPSLIFSNKKILFDRAIVLLMQMKKEIINTAPSPSANKEIFRTYHHLGVCVNKIADFLKQRGYKAQAGPAIGGEVNYPLLAQKAGLGQIGKHGLLITPKLGVSLRIATVYTEIENLPKSGENIHQWIADFCDGCSKCVRECPADAIYKKTKIFKDSTHQHIDYKKCAIPFSNQYGCTVCVKECVFFKGNYEKIRQSYYAK